ncbi:16S rRNA (guanine(527)-N(7))-methyltransferase RsmG [Candidatus Aerophobetes bacterium]|nr:16S rRNA (guanine(527)-N(7))-methyltransferase RsmG [Candidatus Aerophobetes bacterium]
MPEQCFLPCILKKGAEEVGVFLSQEKIEKFLIYLEELKRWNKKINLTALEEDKEIIVKHFLDSLTLCSVMNKIPQEVVDIGPGAGFPSLPLKIVLPQIKCTLVEARKKKVDFLHHIVEKLCLKGVVLINKRAEEFAREKEARGRFDVAVARAVAKLNILLEYTLPYLKIGGYLISQKGRYPEKEVEEAKRALSILGGEVERIKKIKLPFFDIPRSLVVIRKIKETPSGYPRRPGIPAKRPL